MRYNELHVDFKPLFKDVEIPKYESERAAGFDLKVHNFKKLYDQHTVHGADGNSIDLNVPTIVLTPSSRVLVGCGFSVAIPAGFQIEVRTRSGMAAKMGLEVLNAPGTIDEDYRGEVGIILLNTTKYDIMIKKGDRLGQGVLMPYYRANFVVTKELPSSTRGEGAYGSTGIR